MVPWAYASLPPIGISIGSAVFAELTVITNTQTGRPRYGTPPVTIARGLIYVSTVNKLNMSVFKLSMLAYDGTVQV